MIHILSQLIIHALHIINYNLRFILVLEITITINRRATELTEPNGTTILNQNRLSIYLCMNKLTKRTFNQNQPKKQHIVFKHDLA